MQYDKPMKNLNIWIKVGKVRIEAKISMKYENSPKHLSFQQWVVVCIQKETDFLQSCIPILRYIINTIVCIQIS